MVNAALVLVTLLACIGGYVQQKKRLAITRALPPAAARDRYEAAERRRERVLLAVTGVLVVVALVALFLRLSA